MSKHAIDKEANADFWKKMRYGATAAVTVGSGLYAVTSVLKKQGVLSNIVEEVKTVMSTAQHCTTDPPKPTVQLTTKDDENRAILNMQLKFAMERQDTQRVLEISRELDKLETAHGMPTNVTTAPAQMQTAPKASMNLSQMQPPSAQMQKMRGSAPERRGCARRAVGGRARGCYRRRRGMHSSAK